MESPPHRRLQVRAPWVELNSRFPALFERWSIQGMHQTATGNRGRVPRDPLGRGKGHFQERVVGRGLPAMPPLQLRRMGGKTKMR